jgi:amino acid permease
MDDQPSALTREELLGGLVGRRVGTTLYAIESRTAYLALKARHATAPAISADVAEEEEHAFLSALAAGRDLPVTPRIQELEQFAPQWAHLVPPSPTIRAELAQRFGEKHRFRASDVPRLRAAMGLDDAVRDAYLGRYGSDLDTIYTDALPWRDRLRWARSRLARRLEELPPFWTSFGLTLTETVGGGLLALPIALAGVGPLPGLVLIVVLGLVNVLTIAAVAEAFARTGDVRWKGAFIGRVVTEYLGRPGRRVLTVTLAAFSIAVLAAYVIGFSATLADATGLIAPVWAAVLFAVVLGFIRRQRLDATVASSLVVGMVNIGVIMALAALALAHADSANLGHAAVPFVGGEPFDSDVVELVFGVVLAAYFGHTSIGNCARVIVRRDSSGRSLITGAVAAMTVAIVLYAVWEVAVGSAVPADQLASEQGTALTPLADVAGPAVLVLGGIFVLLAMGMASVHVSLGLYNQISERLHVNARLASVGGLSGVAAVFVVAEVLLITEVGTFAGPIALTGALAVPLLAGIFPVLLLAASRRRGDFVPAGTWPWLGRPIVLGALYLLSLGAVLVYGLVIWQTPVERLLALGVAASAVAMTALVLRSDMLAPMVTVELRRERERGRDVVQVTAAGTVVRSELLPAGTRELSVDLDGLGVRALRLRMHQVDPGGESEPLDLSASLREAEHSEPLAPSDDPRPLDSGGATLELHLPRISPLGR